MNALRLGIDVDGVIADFNAAYRAMFVTVTGRDTFNGETTPPCWNYHRHYGYTDAECAEVWARIHASPTFWAHLDPLPDARQFLRWIYWRIAQGPHEVYFITNREGVGCKRQTEEWLRRHDFPGATVLIARGDKGALADGLRLTHMLDDRPENLFVMPPGVVRCLRTASYNTWAAGAESLRLVDTLDTFVSGISTLLKGAA